MLEKLIGKKIRVAVAFITASSLNMANITKYYEGTVVDVDNDFIELDCGYINKRFIQTMEVLDK